MATPELRDLNEKERDFRLKVPLPNLLAGEDMVLTVILAVSAVLVIIDQVIKYFIVQNLAPDGAVSVIDHLFALVYVENRGVAFGLFQNHVWIFALITFVLIGVMIWLIVKKKLTGKLFYVSCMLIIGGGIGNLIDRLFRGFVVDYLSLSFFPPVCNFADYCVTIGAVLLVIVIMMQSRRKETAETDTNSTVSGEQDGE